MQIQTFQICVSRRSRTTVRRIDWLSFSFQAQTAIEPGGKGSQTKRQNSYSDLAARSSWSQAEMFTL